MINSSHRETARRLGWRPLSVASLRFLVLLSVSVLSPSIAAFAEGQDARGTNSPATLCAGIVVRGRVFDKKDTPINDVDLKLMKFLGEVGDRVETVLTPDDPKTTTDSTGSFSFCAPKEDRYVIESYYKRMRAFLLSSKANTLAVVDATQGKRVVDLGNVRAPFDR